MAELYTQKEAIPGLTIHCYCTVRCILRQKKNTQSAKLVHNDDYKNAD